MFTIRRSADRGYAHHGWLEARHTFSFAGYHDKAHMGFRSLRVINEDRVAPGEGFPTHPHNDMEILTYIISGELAHKDSMGNGRTIKPGEVQGMSAGSGVTHSEFNARSDTPVHLLQIWILPHTRGVTPSYAEWLPSAQTEGWSLAASETGEAGSINIHQDAKMYVAACETEKTLPLPIAEGRFGWLQIAKGSATINGETLAQGDGASFSADAVKTLTASAGSELLLFDLG